MTDQYIITEEQLQEVYEHCDWGMTNWTKFKDTLRPVTTNELLKSTNLVVEQSIRQDEREKVLAVPLNFHKQYPRKALYTNGFIIDELEELRKQEQP